MHRAPRGQADIAGQPPDQQLADLPGAPMRLVLLGCDDHSLDLIGQLVGVAHRTTRAIGKRLQAVILVPVENFVAGLSGYPERPAHLAHSFPVKQTRHETKTLLHYRTLLPRHQHLPPKSEKCYPCVRYETSPMSRVAQSPSKPRNAAVFHSLGG